MVLVWPLLLAVLMSTISVVTSLAPTLNTAGTVRSSNSSRCSRTLGLVWRAGALLLLRTKRNIPTFPFMAFAREGRARRRGNAIRFPGNVLGKELRLLSLRQLHE